MYRLPARTHAEHPAVRSDWRLIAQGEARVEHYRRNADGSWTYRVAGPGGQIVLTGGGTLAIDDT